MDMKALKWMLSGIMLVLLSISLLVVMGAYNSMAAFAAVVMLPIAVVFFLIGLLTNH